MDISYRIKFRSLRSRLNLSQQEFAGTIDFSSKTISLIERGEAPPSPAILKTIKEIYKIDLNAPNFFQSLAHVSLPENLPEAA